MEAEGEREFLHAETEGERERDARMVREKRDGD